MTTLGLMLLLFSIGTGSFFWGRASGPYDWMKIMPSRIVLFLAASEDEPLQAAALAELLARVKASTISAGRRGKVVDVGLLVQADDSRPWHDLWRQIVETAWRDGHMSEDQMRRYARQAMRPHFVMPAELPQSGPWYCYLAAPPQRPIRAGITLFAVIDELWVDDERVQCREAIQANKDQSPFPERGVGPNSGGYIIHQSAIGLTGVMPGERTVRCTWRIRYAIGQKVVDDTLESVTTTTVISRQRDGFGVWWGGARTDAELFAAATWVTPPTVDLHPNFARIVGSVYWGGARLTGAYEVFWRTADQEIKIAEVTVPDPGRSTLISGFGTELPEGFRPAAVQVVLRPVPGTAKRHRFLNERPGTSPTVLPEIVFPAEPVEYREVRWRGRL